MTTTETPISAQTADDLPCCSAQHPETPAEKQATGLRALADFLEQNPDFALNEHYADSLWSWHISDDAQKLADMISAAHDHGASITYRDANSTEDTIRIAFNFGGVCPMVITYRKLLEAPVTDPDNDQTSRPQDGVEIGALA